MRFIALLIGGLIFSTALIAIETKDNPSPPLHQENKGTKTDLLKLFPKMHHENMINDDYLLGRSPELGQKNTQGK